MSDRRLGGRMAKVEKLNEALADIEAVARFALRDGHPWPNAVAGTVRELHDPTASALLLRAMVMRAELWAAMLDRNDSGIEVPDA